MERKPWLLVPNLKMTMDPSRHSQRPYRTEIPDANDEDCADHEINGDLTEKNPDLQSSATLQLPQKTDDFENLQAQRKDLESAAPRDADEDDEDDASEDENENDRSLGETLTTRQRQEEQISAEETAPDRRWLWSV